ncbi:MAG TPA: GTP 3',8-cyclase MoaA [Kofleriaceae bacterium]|nr:GTP 3',8-cyclase MoaA [Kofleriaceae bacterium]
MEPSGSSPARARVNLPVIAAQAPAARAEIAPIPGAGDPLLDRFARRIRYLRVSVTDRCNYACTYCVPDEGVAHRLRAELLTFEELARVVGVFAGLGVRRVRLTGGEPTVRAGFVDLVSLVRAVPGIDEVVMTTNGHRLAELAGPLAAAGLAGANVSLDTLDPARFAALTGGGDLARVLAGVDAALAAGLRVKLNAVALAGTNDGELAALCEAAWARGVVMRFIEHMPLSDGALYRPERELSAAAIRARLEADVGPLVAASADRGIAGPARYWALASDPRREVGIISAMTEHFCDDCNRLRLTADGQLHACLGHDDAVSLKDLVRAGATDDDLRAAIAGAVAGKRAGHEFQRSGAGGPTKHMITMGG